MQRQVKSSKDEWVFAGIYESISVKETPNGPSQYRYDTKLVDIGTDLIGKMIIGFKKDFRASYLCLENYIEDFEVLEITRDVCKTEFPGYDKVNVSWEELSGLIDTDAWKTALANQKGVYLITDSSNGKKYVGSATGENMICYQYTSQQYCHDVGSIFAPTVTSSTATTTRIYFFMCFPRSE